MKDDEANKAVFVDGRISFAYAGLGQIGVTDRDQRTDEWLARVAASAPAHDFAVLAEKIRQEATNAFARISCPPDRKRHAFQGAGWFRLPGEHTFTPGIINIHNAIDPSTGAWLSAARPEFSVDTILPTHFPAGSMIASVGKSLAAAEQSEVKRLLRKCLRHSSVTPRMIASVLARCMQLLAQRYEPRSPIGKSLILTCIPRRAVERMDASGETFLLTGPPSLETPSFCCLSSTGQLSQFGPHFVSGQSVLSGLTVTPI